MQVDETNFTALFGPTATLLEGTDPSGNSIRYWDGNLSLPSNWLTAHGVKGLAFDTASFREVLPNPGSGVQAPMPQGWQSPGNAGGQGATDLFPQQIADLTYNFPLSGLAVPTGTIGFVEPGIGTALPAGSASFESLLERYRHAAGIDGPVVVTSVAGGGQAYPNTPPGTPSSAGERSLDVGVVTTINPMSHLVLYAGSGSAADAGAGIFTAYQSAFWDTTNNPQVISSSFSNTQQPSPSSPFHFAISELFVDAALRNISVFTANGDGGSGDRVGNGLTNVSITVTSPYGVLVGGTSLSTVHSAIEDSTLATITTAAMAGDKATIWALIAGGLTALPDPSNDGATLIETVWNKYFLDGTTIASPGGGSGFLSNNAGSGGVDPTQPVPSYQSDFGLVPTTSDRDRLVGRGTPDVSANAGGNLLYKVPPGDLIGMQNDDGTSAATPLWAALGSQLNAIFHDQGLPQLGYMNDLLYIAAAIAPASFNDVTVGNNTSSFALGGPFTSDATPVTPTGFGYSAGPGYDLATGLGSPNGLILARTLAAIGHQQMSFAANPGVVDSNGADGWKTAVDETLLIQATSDGSAAVRLVAGSQSLDFASMGSAEFAWTSQIAEQSLQADFDARLVRLFDKHAQGALGQATATAGGELEVLIDGFAGHAPQANLSSSFGFADFVSGGDAVRVARPVAVAETAGGQDDQQAVVRIRQNGEDQLSLTLYRVDDLNGTINGLHPGDPGYEAAANARAYATTSGAMSIDGPGYGNYTQALLTDVDAGDLIAVKLINKTFGDTYWAFSQGNEQAGGAHVGHLWNYGLNTWGWEDTKGGGDRDYNDLIVGLDFASASGHGWLV